MNTGNIIKFLNTFHGVPFTWGTNDCSTFIVKYLEFITGKSYKHLAPFTWRSKKEAIRFARKNKVSVSTILSEGVSAVKVPTLTEAKAGDILIIDQDGWDTAGVLINGKIAWFVEDLGLIVSPLPNATIKLILRAN